MSPIRRRNDAQTERFLSDLKSLAYRQALARKHAGIRTKTLPAKGTDKRRAYMSRMRMLERYVTEGEQKRSFANAPLPYVRELRSQARSTPRPVSAPPRPARPAPPPAIPFDESERPPFFGKVEARPLPPDYIPYSERKFERDISLYDLNAILAFHDGDAHEASEALGTGRNGAYLLDLAAKGVNVFSARGSGALTDGARDLFDELHADDVEDIDDFSALLHQLPPWKIEMILNDMTVGDTTFADWLDAWRADGMPADFDTDNSEYWELFREMYARSK